MKTRKKTAPTESISYSPALSVSAELAVPNQFRPLALPSMFWKPNYLKPELPAWIGHIPFAFWIIEALTPSTFVELGTHYANSYFAFCQAVDRLGLSTACFAVDTWKGDEHAGFYGDEVFAAVNTYNSNNYSGISTLVRSTFDEALPHFEDGTIDLLHIDGHHTFEAVRHDFETWLPKLSNRAVVLFHDTNVRFGSFGVNKYFAKLKADYPWFEFNHSHGLGVLGVGSEQPENVKHLFQTADSANATGALHQVFSRLGQACIDLGEAQIVRKRVLDLEAQIGAKNQEIAECLANTNQERGNLSERIAQLEAERANLENQLAALQTERDGRIAGLEGAVNERDGRIAGLEGAVNERDGRIAGLEGAVSERDGRIAGLEGAVNERDGRIAGLEGAVSERDGRIAGLEGAVSERDGRIAGLEGAVSERDGRIAGLEGAVSERDGRIAGLEGAVSERDGRIAGLEGAVSELQSERDSLASERSTLDARLSTLHSERDNLATRHQQLATEREALSTDLQERFEELAKLAKLQLSTEDERNALQAKVSELQAAYDDLATERSTLDARLSTLSSEHSTLATERDDLASAIQEIHQSTCWKFTSPIRAVGGFRKKIINAIHRFLISLRILFTHQNSGIFDPAWYLEKNPDVKAASARPFTHFCFHGVFEGRAPSAAFNAEKYLAQNPDVVRSGITPEVHYLLHGWREGR